MIYTSTSENIDSAVAHLERGRLVAFPTETVYGLGANALDGDAVQTIFKSKGRPSNNPLIVHCSAFSEIFKYVKIDSLQTERLNLLKSFWPGPLSVVLPKNHLIPNETTANLDSVAVRIPNHTVALSLLKKCPFPLAAPSANTSSYVSATTALHVQKHLGDKVAMILDGGATEIGLESTVLSLLEQEPEILRPGYITKAQIESALTTNVRVRNQMKTGEALLSPGMMKKHYSPITSIRFISSVENEALPENIGFISFGNTKNVSCSINFKKILKLSDNGNFEEIASNLFSAIRELDEDNLDLILIDSCDISGFGEAIMDRLFRATSQ